MPDDNRLNRAYARVLAAVRTLPTPTVIYSAALGAVALAQGHLSRNQLELLATPAGALGVNLFSDLLGRVADGLNDDDDAIRRDAEAAVNQSQIADALTRDQFRQDMARLAGGTNLRALRHSIEAVGRDTVEQLVAEFEARHLLLMDEVLALRSALAGAGAIPTTPDKVPNMVRPLPDEYVERGELFRRILASLLDDAGDPRHSEASPRYVTLLGEGGFGKTTLAQAIGLDKNINEAFTGGVLFATLGESGAQLSDKWNAMLQALTGSNQTAADPIAQLKVKLQADDFLIILDDVWDRAHIAPLLGIARCTYLITTRDDGIAALATEAAARHAVAEMLPDEALAVLKRYIPPDKRAGIDKTLEAEFKAFAAALGEWPLLLDIHGRAMREECQRGMSADEALAYVREGLREEGLDPFPQGQDADTQRRTLRGSMNASLRRYADDEKQRLYELAIFPEDTALPEAAVLKLWAGTAGLGSFGAKKLLRRIAGHFCRFGADADQALVVRLHDKIREYLGGELADAAAIHRAFLAAYGVARWPDLPADEPYLWKQIGYHLIEAGRGAELRALLLDAAFLRAKLAATDVNALIDDCELALTPNPSPSGRGASEAGGEAIRLLHSALGMSAHALIEDKAALASQLVGRLATHRRAHADLRALTDALMTAPGVYPLDLDDDQLAPALQQAGGYLLRTLTGHTGDVNGALELHDGRILSWSSDRTLRLWSSAGDPLAVLEGHTDRVTGALALDDGRFLSWAGEYEAEDHTLRLWSSEGAPLALLEGHMAGVSSALALDDGRLLSWSDDNTLRLWSSEGAPLAVLGGYSYQVSGVLALADGRFLSWSLDGTLRLWSAEGDPLAVLTGHRDRVAGALALEDGRFLSWSMDKTLRLWSSDGAPLAVLEGHTGGVSSALALADGRFLSWSNGYYGSKDHTLRLWSSDGVSLAVLEGHTDRVNGALVLADGRFLSWSWDNMLRLWSSAGVPLAILQGRIWGVQGARVLPDGRFLSWSRDKTLRLWSSEGTSLAAFEGHTEAVWGALALADGRLLSWSGDGTLRLWSAEGAPPRAATAPERHMDNVTGALALADGRFLSWSWDATLRLWSSEGTLLAVLEEHSQFIAGALALADGCLLSWSFDTTLRLWSSEGAPLAVLAGHTDGVSGALALDYSRFLSWSVDRTLRLWSSHGAPLAILEGHTDNVTGALALADGRLLSWAGNFISEDHTLRLWSPEGVPQAILEGHTTGVRGALALADGHFVSWAGKDYLTSDYTLRLWSLAGAPLAVLEGHSDGVIGALALADGRFLSWSSDKTLRLWSSEGAPLAVLDKVILSRDRSRIFAWAHEHGFDPEILFADTDPTMYDAYRVGRRSLHLDIYRRADGVTVATFHADAPITAVITDPARGLIVAGDAVGRVMFLRWPGEG